MKTNRYMPQPLRGDWKRLDQLQMLATRRHALAVCRKPLIRAELTRQIADLETQLQETK